MTDRHNQGPAHSPVQSVQLLGVGLGPLPHATVASHQGAGTQAAPIRHLTVTGPPDAPAIALMHSATSEGSNISEAPKQPEPATRSLQGQNGASVTVDVYYTSVCACPQ